MATQEQRGATLGAQTAAPSVNLARLVELLATAIPEATDSPGRPSSWPFLSWSPEHKRLRVNTGAVLARLFANQEFLAAFAAEDDSGFMRDLALPGRHERIVLGGRLFGSQQGKLTGAVRSLLAQLGKQLESADPTGKSLATLFSPNAQEAMVAIAHRTGVVLDDTHADAVLMPLQFDQPPAKAGLEEAARIISVIEEVEADGWLSTLLAGLRALMTRRAYDDSIISAAEESLREQARHQNSELNHFLNFLEDEALARVRLATAMELMSALAHHAKRDGAAASKSPFADYVFRIEALRDAFASPESDGLSVDLEKHYGTGCLTNLGHRMRAAGFYRCFAVWPQWTAQLFETRRQEEATGSIRAIREVSYRFRINGIDPSSGKTSYLTRLDRIRAVLLDAKGREFGPNEVMHAACELIALGAAFGGTQAARGHAVDTARALAAEFAGTGKKAIARVLDDLKANAGAMDAVAEALVAMLRERRQDVLSRAHRAIASRYVSVMSSIFELDRLATASPQSRGLLARPKEGGSDHAEWFKHIETADTPVEGSVFSVKVSMRMLQRIAYANRERTHKAAVRRESTGPMLQVALREFDVERTSAEARWIPASDDRDKPWLTDRGVDVEVRLRQIELRRASNEVSLESARHRHAAAGAALGVLVHGFLYCLCRRLEQQNLLPEGARILLIRLQGAPKSDRSTDGTEMFYALSQAFETALERELPTKMQGIVTAEDHTERFRRRGALHAALACFPVVIQTADPASIPRVGLMTYATRPCATAPGNRDADSYLFTLKSYIGTTVSEPAAALRVDRLRTQFHIVENKAGFENPTLILEELADMKAQGCTHVILLSHHYGSRRLNRLADRHTPHSGPQFLDRVGAAFEDLTIYPIRRDVFPATRLLRRPGGVSGFEVGRVREHEQLFDDAVRDLLKGFIPVYTFATLAVVGDESKRPQSGFCTYFLDTDFRIGRTEWMEKARTHLIDPHQDSPVRPALIGMLRALHFLEAERPPSDGVALPVLDPFEWAFPDNVAGVGEVDIVKGSRRQGTVAISYAALLSHMVDVFHRERS